MSYQKRWLTLLSGGCCLVGLAVAQETGPAAQGPVDEKLARLTGLLEAQQRRLQTLEAQVFAVHTRDAERARVELMRAQIREVLGESEFRESLMQSTTQAGYNGGFFIRSSDDQFELKINGRIQFRWTHYATRSGNKYLNPGLQRDDRTGFDVQRIRLGFRGHAYDRNLTYRVVLRMGASNSYDTRLHYAYLNYKFREDFQFRAGIFKIASTRAQMTSSAKLQFVDRPAADAVFQFSRGLGVRFWGRLFDKRLDYYLDIVNSFNGVNNRTITPDPAELDGNPGIVFHAVWHAFGDNPGKDFKSQADHAFHESPALDFGFHYAFNDDQSDARTTRIPFKLPRRFGTGGFGNTTTNGLQINQFGLESAFKWNGFSATGEYILRIVDVRRATRRPFTPLFLATGDDSTTTMHGAYLQVGYFLPIPGLEKKLEAVGRVGGISVLSGGQEGTWEYAGGLNYYIQGDKVKLQTDVTKVSEVPIRSSSGSLANVNDDALIFRVQLQVSF